MHLFAYGTLMFPAVWQRVVGRVFRVEPARLPGYAAYHIRGDVYPVLVAERGSEAPGVVYFDVDPQTLAMLDAYESDIYVRSLVDVQGADGTPLSCHAYLLAEKASGLCSTSSWDAEWFQEHALAKYLRRF